jgi:predicted Zn-dependent protease
VDYLIDTRFNTWRRTKAYEANEKFSDAYRNRFNRVSYVMKLIRLLPLVLMLLINACSTSPTGRSQLLLMPANQMDQMGVAAFNDMKKKSKLSQNKKTIRYVECVADAVTAILPARQQSSWEVIVFADDSANAFALPGGKIGVNTGLLSIAVDQHQLAAVIGHEVAHVLAEHGNERMSLEFATQTGAQLLGAVLADTQEKPMLMAAMGLGIHYGMKLPYSRTHEAEADVMGLDLMAQAGFNPQSSLQLWRNMNAKQDQAPPEFMSTHPAHSTRIDGLSAHMSSALSLYQNATQQGRRPSCQR